MSPYENGYVTLVHEVIYFSLSKSTICYENIQKVVFFNFFFKLMFNGPFPVWPVAV